jgi:hypothetical protein
LQFTQLERQWDQAAAQVRSALESRRERAIQAVDQALAEIQGLERLEALAEPEERQHVRVGLAGIERENDPGVLRVMSEAFRSPHAERRKVGYDMTLILRWPALVQNLKEAIAGKPDASLRGQMLEVVDHIGASGT